MTVSKGLEQCEEIEALEMKMGKWESNPVLGWKLGFCVRLMEELVDRGNSLGPGGQEGATVCSLRWGWDVLPESRSSE